MTGNRVELDGRARGGAPEFASKICWLTTTELYWHNYIGVPKYRFVVNPFPEGGNMTRYRIGGAVVAAFALTVTIVRADLVPEGQARSVKSTVGSVEQIQSSGDDLPFNASVASVFSAPYVLPNTQV